MVSYLNNKLFPVRLSDLRIGKPEIIALKNLSVPKISLGFTLSNYTFSDLYISSLEFSIMNENKHWFVGSGPLSHFVKIRETIMVEFDAFLNIYQVNELSGIKELSLEQDIEIILTVSFRNQTIQKKSELRIPISFFG